MRALFVTAVACLAVAACGQSDQIPPGAASRVTAADGLFSIAVPAGWSDTTADNCDPDPVQCGVHELAVGPASEPKAVAISSPQIARGIDGGGDPGGPQIHVTIAGEPVTGMTFQGAVNVAVQHTADGKALWFHAWCPVSLIITRDTCLAVIDSWHWETPRSSRDLAVVVAGALGATVVASSTVAFVLLRRRRGAAS